MNELYEYIIKSYQSLWHIKNYDKTIEITTPVATTNDMFVTVFVTKRGDDYIATDGGWIQSGLYECEIQNGNVYKKVFNYYLEKFCVQQTLGQGHYFYIKKTQRAELLPNIVFDMAYFIGSVVSSAGIQYVSDRTEATFKKNARGYLRQLYGEEAFDYDKPISDNLNIKFNAIARRNDGARVINFVSGSNSSYYANSLCRSNMNFEMLLPHKEALNVRNMITLLDDRTTSVIESPQVQMYYNFLLDNRSDERPVVLWNQKTELNRYVA